MRRYEFTDERRELIADLFPFQRGPGRRYRDHHIAAVIPARQLHYPRLGRPPQLAYAAYKRRNVIERCIGWLKHARRIATRYEKTAVNFLAMLKLAMIQRYFRIQLRDTTKCPAQRKLPVAGEW
jgi:hypothetical protein